MNKLSSLIKTQKVQFSPDKHDVELHGSTYTWNFFSSKHYKLQELRLIDSKDTEESHV